MRGQESEDVMLGEEEESEGGRGENGRDNGRQDYSFDMRRTSLKVVDDTSIELCCEKPRKFTFRSHADTVAFRVGFEKTKAWLEAGV